MTFGETLKALLDVSNIKQSQLAAHLGYDVSYISRWLNDSKLPSAKNNSAIFAQIAEYISKNVNESEKNAICSMTECEPGSSDGELAAEIRGILEKAYEFRSSQPPARSVKPSFFEYNSNISWITVSRAMINKAMADVVAEKTRDCTEKTVKVFAVSAGEDFSYSECRDFWMPVIKDMADDAVVHIDMLAPFAETKYACGMIRDMLVFLFSLDSRIEADFYMRPNAYDENYSVWICKDALCVEGSYDRFLRKYKTFFTKDTQVVSEYYGAAIELLRTRTLLTERRSFEELYNKKYFQNFMLNGRFTALFNVMPATFLSPELKRALFAEYELPNMYSEMSEFFEKTLQSWSVVVYRSAVIDFFFDGKTYFNGRTVCLEKSQRSMLLESLLGEIGSGRGTMTILDDSNPILNRNDVGCALFMCSRSVFAHRFPNNGSAQEKSGIVTINDSSVIDCCEELFKNIYGLPNTFVVRGDEAAAFLRQGFKLIRG